MTPGLAPETVHDIHATIHRALVDAAAWKYIDGNPASKAKPPWSAVDLDASAQSTTIASSSNGSE
jgi:hypothetical protein